VKRGEKTIESVVGSPYDKEIVSLFTQLQMNDAQQRMLRQSYMGRAKELAEYLRGRLGPAGPAAAKAQPAPTAVAGEQPQQDAEWPQQVVEPAPPVNAEAISDVWPGAAPPAATEAANGGNGDKPQETEFGFGANAGAGETAPPPRQRGRPRKSPQGAPAVGSDATEQEANTPQNRTISSHFSGRVEMSFPKTRSDLISAGYQFVKPGTCAGCHKAVEWWAMPTGLRMPMNEMPDDNSEAAVHLVTCPFARSFRKKAASSNER
jgi:hypothetical protein